MTDRVDISKLLAALCRWACKGRINKRHGTNAVGQRLLAPDAPKQIAYAAKPERRHKADATGIRFSKVHDTTP